jgi:hypothetical protein
MTVDKLKNTIKALNSNLNLGIRLTGVKQELVRSLFLTNRFVNDTQMEDGDRLID